MRCGKSGHIRTRSEMLVRCPGANLEREYSKLVEIVTDRDLVKEVMAEGKDPKSPKWQLL